MSDLWEAASEVDLNEVLRQIAAHADINWTANLWGATPLYIVAEEGHDAIVEVLLQHGAGLYQATDGRWSDAAIHSRL
jgi:ankyrin repeat protein